MTLSRLALAWVAVAVWFLVATLLATPLLTAALSRPPEQAAVPVGVSGSRVKSVAPWRLAEAAILTLFASLWFDSLGSGGWWLLFLLVGLLVAGAEWFGVSSRADVPLKATLAGACADVARYVAAGAILAWRLG